MHTRLKRHLSEIRFKALAADSAHCEIRVARDTRPPAQVRALCLCGESRGPAEIELAQRSVFAVYRQATKRYADSI